MSSISMKEEIQNAVTALIGVLPLKGLNFNASAYYWES